VGVGLYNQHVIGSVNDNVSALINGRSAITFPLGAGIDIPLTHNFSIAAEGAYHAMLQTSTVDPTPVNNLWTASGLLRLSL
jgi:opacity protein-like surface antigen